MATKVTFQRFLQNWYFSAVWTECGAGIYALQDRDYKDALWTGGLMLFATVLWCRAERRRHDNHRNHSSPE